MRSPPLPAPLLWQLWPLFAICGILAGLWPAPGLFCALLLFCLDRRLRAPSRFLLALTFFAAGYAGSALTEPAWREAPKSGRICARIDGARGFPERRWQIALSGLRDEQGGEIAGRALWNWDEGPENPPLAGQRVCLSRPLLPLRGFYNEPVSLYERARRAAGFDWRIWSRGDGGDARIWGEAEAGQALRASWRNQFVDILKNGEGTLAGGKALLPALLFGDRFYLEQRAADNFSRAAIAHSLALSGQHLALAALIGLGGVWLAARLRPEIFLACPRPVLALLAGCPAALLYLWLGNAPPSLLRAACMMFALALFAARSRIFSGQDIVFIALALFLLFAPLSILDVGMQLSFLCVLVIALYLPGIRRLSPCRGWLRGGLARIFVISLLVQAALLPLLLAYFGQAGLWFPINVIWLPALGLIILPCAAIGLCLALLPGLDWGAAHILNLAAWPCDLLLAALEKLRAAGFLGEPAFLRPHWSVLPAFALLAAALAWLAGGALARGQCKKILLLGLLLLLAGPSMRLFEAFSQRLSLEALDVGQGEALLLRLPAGERLLADAGGSRSRRFDPGAALVAPALLANAAPRLVALLNSHPDLDHAGGLFYLARNLEYGALFHNGREAAGFLAERWRALAGQALAAGDVLRPKTGDVYIEVLHPPRDAGWRGNNASLVLRLCRGGEGLALLPGDAEIPALRQVLASGRDISARVLVAPHHGSNGSFLPAFYRAVRPEVVIAPCGFANRYGYPGARLRAWAEKNGVPLLNTGDNGRIRVDFFPDGRLRAAPTLGPAFTRAAASARQPG